MGPIDPATLGRMYDAYGAQLLLYARQWLDDRSAAEDVVQEAFVRLAGQPALPRNARAWLYAVVRNAAVTERRGRLRRDRREHSVAAERDDWFEPSFGSALDAATAQRALDRLPPEQREVIVLRIWGGLTLTEAAEVTGDAISTLHSRYRSGLAALRDALGATTQEEPSCTTMKSIPRK